MLPKGNIQQNGYFAYKKVSKMFPLKKDIFETYVGGELGKLFF